MKKAAPWEMLQGEEQKRSEITSKDKELVELRLRMKRMEKEIKELRSITARLDKKSLAKKEKKASSGKEDGARQKEMVKVIQERDEILRKEWNDKVNELQRINQQYEESIAQECNQFLDIVARTKSIEIKEKSDLGVTATKIKIPLWSIKAEYAVRVARGENWKEVKCIRCEIDKLISARDYKVKEVLHVRDTLWICVNKMGDRADLLHKKTAAKIEGKFVLKAVHTNFSKLMEELKEEGLWCIHEE